MHSHWPLCILSLLASVLAESDTSAPFIEVNFLGIVLHSAEQSTCLLLRVCVCDVVHQDDGVHATVCML